MNRLTNWLGAGALALTALTLTPTAQGQQPKPAAKPQVEVVFCLDTTGSMGGLIDAAKSKIWSICNQIAAGKPTPQLRVGLVAYRDRGDEYITKVFDLTDDLDAVYTNLMAFKAQGGGDFPESVNQALFDSVHKIKWSADKKTLKIIFLVGDAPPHMDYKDDVKYPDTCKVACTKDIIINSVQCGNHAETMKYWKDICRLAEGSYVQIDARGGPVVAIATPFDEELAKLNTTMARSMLTYGHAEFRREGGKAKKAIEALPTAPAADRAGFGGITGSLTSKYDLLDAVKSGKVKLAEVKKDELPEELKKLTLKEQEAFLAKCEKERTELNKRAAELNQKRAEFIAKKMKEDQTNRARDSFDGQVLRVLATQARRINVQYAIDGDEKKK